MHVCSGGAALLWGVQNICVSSKCSCYCGQNAAGRLTQKSLLVRLQNVVCLSAYTSLSRSIFGSPVTHSIKRGQQILEIFFPLTQRNQFRFQVILPPVHWWQLERIRGALTFIGVPSLRPRTYTRNTLCFICAPFARSALLATQDQI